MAFMRRRFPRRVTRPACWTLAAVALLAGGCRRASDDAVTVGLVASLTGRAAAVGTSIEEGVQLALDEINAAGGVLGKRIRVVTEDDRSTLQDSVTAVAALVKRERVAALLGEVASGHSLAAAPIVQDHGVPTLSPGCTSPRLTAVGSYLFRACYVDGMQAAAMARFAVQSQKLSRVAILVESGTDASAHLARVFRDTVQQLGGTVVAEQSYGPTDVDFKAQLTALRAENPQAVYVPGRDTAVALIVRQARDLGLGAAFLGGDVERGSQVVEIGGKAVDGVHFTTHWSEEEQRPEVQKFVADYRARYGGKTPDAMAALGYDAMKMMAAAIARAGTTDGAKIRDALAATQDFPGVSGRITLDAQRNAQKPVVVVRIQDGRTRFVEAIPPPG